MKRTIAIKYLILLVGGAVSTAQGTAQPGLTQAANGDGDRAGDETRSGRKAQRLRAMQSIAEAVTVRTIGPESDTKIGLVEGARFRFSTPEIGCFDGTAWLWGAGQRPVVQVTLSAEQFMKDGPCQWSYEFTSLSPAKLWVTSHEGWKWNPEEAGLDFQPLANAPAPAESSARRLRQMKEQSRRFDAYGLYGPELPPGEAPFSCSPHPTSGLTWSLPTSDRFAKIDREI